MTVMRTGRSGAGLHAVMSLVMVLGIGLCMPSWAFFPQGGFKLFENTPVLLRWSLDAIDTTGNGQVESPADGVLVTIDIGDEGFTAAEANAIRDGFQVWQDVPGAYMAFRFQEIEGPFPFLTADELGLPNDRFNSVTLGEPGAVFGDTYKSFVLEDEAVLTDPVTGQQFLVRGPQILEADIVISRALFRPEEPVVPNPEDPISLIPRTPGTIRAVIPINVGSFSGLGFTPLNNIRADSEDELFSVEDAVTPYRGADGRVRIVGATPSMYNAFILTENEGDGTVSFHIQDLAYDDIAGIMYMYPRVEQRDELFTIAQEARTGVRPGFTSSPIVGGHVIAWVDHDRNPTTNRVPLFSTMTGLFVNEQPIGELSGRFQLLGLFKRLIDENGALFSPDYVISVSPITEAPAILFDSMHNTGPNSTRAEGVYTTAFPFEVYNEAGNLFNRSNVRFGTPLYFDTVRRQVVSRDSGLTLSQQLRRNTPMFGAESDVCFFDVIGEPGGGGGGIQSPQGLAVLPGIRAFRDNVMLRSRVGAAASDVYYRIAPAIASYLAANELALAAARAAFSALAWLAMAPKALWGAVLVALAGMAAFSRRRRRAVAATAAMLFVFGGGAAHATVVFDTPEQMVQKSDAIIMGEVIAVHSYYSVDMLPAQIVTDVSVSVSKSLKGPLNKGGTVTIRVPGGRVGGHVVTSAVQPTLNEGEEVVLFVSSARKNIGLTLPYGKHGTLHVVQDPETGAKSLQAGSIGGIHQVKRITAAANDAALKRGLLKSESEVREGESSVEAFTAFVEEAEAKADR